MNLLEKLLQQKKCFLEKKTEYERKITELSNMITPLNNSIYNECGRIGHEYVTEIESGMYGETYHICKICGLHNY
jgi:hypothetical protein